MPRDSKALRHVQGLGSKLTPMPPKGYTVNVDGTIRFVARDSIAEPNKMFPLSQGEKGEHKKNTSHILVSTKQDET